MGHDDNKELRQELVAHWIDDCNQRDENYLLIEARVLRLLPLIGCVKIDQQAKIPPTADTALREKEQGVICYGSISFDPTVDVEALSSDMRLAREYLLLSFEPPNFPGSYCKMNDFEMLKLDYAENAFVCLVSTPSEISETAELGLFPYHFFRTYAPDLLGATEPPCAISLRAIGKTVLPNECDWKSYVDYEWWRGKY